MDVGYGQLAWRLRQDERVVVHDRTNIRDLDLETVGGPVDLVVGDLSFISLTMVLDALIGVTAEDGDLVLMVKPQFEVGRSRVGKGGVVREPALRADAVETVADVAADPGVGCAGGDREPAARTVGQRGVLPVAATRTEQRGPGGDRRGGVGGPSGEQGEKVIP